MQAVADTYFTAGLVNPALGESLDLGARIEVPVTRAIASDWRRATLEGTTWVVSIEAPAAGEYMLVWRTDDPEPAYETFVPLIVTAGSVVTTDDFEPVDRTAVRPTQDDVAALENTRLVASGGREIVEFTDETNPTAEQVEALIDRALPLVLGELPDRIPTAHYDTAKNAVALYTAMLVEGSHFREQADDGSAELWRTLYTTAILNLKRSIDADLNQWRLLRARNTDQGPRILA
jgi:hypothetical protein